MWSAGLAGLLMIPQGLASSLTTLMLARLGMVFFAGGLASVFQIWLAKSTPDSQRGVLFGWATTAKSCGWFLSSLGGGVVAVHFGVRWVFFGAAIVFILLVPATRMITLRHARGQQRAATPGGLGAAPAPRDAAIAHANAGTGS
jgi:MFS family permease